MATDLQMSFFSRLFNKQIGMPTPKTNAYLNVKWSGNNNLPFSMRHRGATDWRRGSNISGTLTIDLLFTKSRI